MKYDLVTILGPTATGKTKLSVKLAYHFNGEIISADSRQVYKGLDLGSGKDLRDYQVNNKTINYYLIDILEPNQEFNVFQFDQYFKKAYKEITSKGKLPFMVGGTGLYLSSILQKYKLPKADFNDEKMHDLEEKSHEELKSILHKINPNLHNTTDLTSKERTIKAIIVARYSKNDKSEYISVNSYNIGINVEKAELKKRIKQRLTTRLEEGMIDEVEGLLSKGVSYEKLFFFGLEYKFIAMYLQKELNYNDMFQKLNSAIVSFAKKQMTWFRKMEREGIKINWLNGPDLIQAKKLIEDNVI